jgi:AcrR family transcriptional regulator
MSKDSSDSSKIDPKGIGLDLSAESGTFFSPDGMPDEDAFRAHVRENLNLLARTFRGRKEFEKQSSEWLAFFLERLTGLLREKGSPEQALAFFRAAAEEASFMSIGRVPLSPGMLRLVLGQAQSTSPPKAKKNAPLNRENIFNAALKLFVEKGFHSTTVDEIAVLCGVGKGTIYRTFRSKEDLLEQLISEKTTEIVSIFSELLMKADDILSLVEEAISCWVRFIEKNHLLYRLIQKEEIMYKPGGKDMFYNTIVSRLPMLKERIVALNTGGKMKTMNFYTTFYGIMGFIDGVVYKWLQSGMGYSLQDELPEILEVLFNGFAGEKAGRKRFFVPTKDQES